MSTEYQIKADYNSANQTAAEMESIAGSLSNMANSDLDGALLALKNIWKGENAERFIQKGDSVKSQILTTAKELRNSARELREAAKSVYNAEMEALRLAAENPAETVRLAREAAEADETV